MTLNTAVYVKDDKLDPREVFDWFNENLLLADDEARGKLHHVQYGPEEHWRDGEWKTDPDEMTINNPCGIGLDAWLFCHFRPDGAPYEEGGHNHYCKEYPEECPECHEEPCQFKLTFDTAYGYSSPEGYGCAMLHAFYLLNLAKYFHDHEVSWAWQNEFTGEIFDGNESLKDMETHLREFTGSGREANDWFRNIVVPAIPAIIDEVTQEHLDRIEDERKQLSNPSRRRTRSHE